MRRELIVLLLVTAIAAAAGCGSGDSTPAPVSPTIDEQAQDIATPLVPPPPPPPPLAVTPAAPAEETAAEKPEEKPKVVRKEAVAGVGKKGHGYGQGLIATPLAAYFRSRERMAFEVQIPKSMQIYKGIHGRAPKTHEEFMEKIIKENLIELPELRPGHRYVYDPKTEQLMVEHPR